MLPSLRSFVAGVAAARQQQAEHGLPLLPCFVANVGNSVKSNYAPLQHPLNLCDGVVLIQRSAIHLRILNQNA